MTWQRARKPEQVAERRQDILRAAAGLFRGLDYDSVSLSGIARRARLAKSNLYRYFHSKEEIFLDLYAADLEEWSQSLDSQLECLLVGSEPERIVEIMTDSFVERPRLLALTSLNATVLERNLNEESLVVFRKRLATVSSRLSNSIRRLLPEIRASQADRLLLYMNALIAGLWPHSRPNEALAHLLQRPDLSHMRVDFERELQDALQTLLSGLIHAAPLA